MHSDPVASSVNHNISRASACSRISPTIHCIYFSHTRLKPEGCLLTSSTLLYNQVVKSLVMRIQSECFLLSLAFLLFARMEKVGSDMIRVFFWQYFLPCS